MPLIPNNANNANNTRNNQLWQRCEPHRQNLKCVSQKVTHRSFRKKTEKFGRELRGVLVKKGCKEGGVSL